MPYYSHEQVVVDSNTFDSIKRELHRMEDVVGKLGEKEITQSELVNLKGSLRRLRMHIRGFE